MQTDSKRVARDMALALESFRVFTNAATRLGITGDFSFPPEELGRFRAAVTQLAIAHGIIALPQVELVAQWRLDEAVGPLAVREVLVEILCVLRGETPAKPASDLEA